MGKLGNATTWQLPDGNIVKSELVMGLTLQIETAEEAVSGVDSGYSPAADFALLTSVTSNIDLPNPRAIRILDIKLSGNLDKKMGICDSRQKVKWLDPVGETQVADFRIDAKVFDAAKSVNLPIEDKTIAEYLEPTAFLQCDSPDIKSTAAKIVGQEKSAYKAAVKIRKWVSENMKPQADMGIPRPSVDVLKVKVGVCRDYAVLYGALARAAGIPTKIVAGIVYMDGHFYYHAWAESYVGEWAPFDATIDSDFVDATHIKLTEGDATSMFDMTAVFGTMKAEIVGYK
jgi:transglutaminase-like putative cysteine protease